jgi:hypothetical protein
MRMSLVAWVLGLALLSGCTNNQKMMLDTWTGVPEEHLFSSWGVPNRIAHSNGVKFLTYDTKNIIGLIVKTNTFRVSAPSGKIIGASCSGLCF